MNIGKWALSNSKLIYYIVVILVLGGLLSYYQMSKLEDPAIVVRQAVVVTIYPGASPHEVELQLTDKLEKAIFSARGVNEVTSYSYADLSIITVTLHPTVPQDDIEQHWDLLRRKVNDVQSELPAGARSSIVADDYGDVFGMFYALTSDGFTNEEMTQYAELVKREVQAIDGISKVQLFGVYSPTIDISIFKDRMANMGVSPLEVIQTIKSQNNVIYSGYYHSGEHRLRVSVGDRSASLEDLENITIKGHQGDQILLKEIAEVKYSYVEPIRNAMYFDKKDAIGISISALDGTDITKLGKQVEEVLAQLKKEQLPVGIEYNKVFNQPERVSSAINDFFLNLIGSVVIVILVLMFTMGFRSGLLLAVTLVVTVLGSILFLNMFDGTLQRVSLASFILAMGMLVDNAIVILDGILIDKAKGKLNSRALTDIGQKTAMPLLGATLIAILAFFPIYLSPDTTGVYIRDLFIVLAISLLLSWILSLTMVPLQAKRMFKKPVVNTVDYSQSKFYIALRKILTFGLQNRTITMLIGIALLGFSVLIYFSLTQSFFPDMNYNQVYIEYKLPESNSSEKTKKDLDSITHYLMSREDVTHVTASVGATPSRYNLVRSIATPALSYGDLIVEFVDGESAVKAIPEIQEHLNVEYSQAYARVKRYNLMYNKFPIEVMFKGPDPDVLRHLTRQAQTIMDENDKIMLVTSDWEQKVPVVKLGYNQAVASDIGISRADVGLSILASTDGIPAETFYDNGKSRTLTIKCVDKEGEPIENLETAPVFPLLPSLNVVNKENIVGLMTGSVSSEDIIEEIVATTPLSQTVDNLSIEWEDPVIIRHNGQRSMRAQANNIPSAGAEDVRQEIIDKVEAIELPEGYTLSWQGEVKTKAESMKYLMQSIPLAIILMIGVLIMLFKDYKKPIIILMCAPLLAVGALFGMWVMGKPFGFVSIVAILGLIGMMIKNGIVLMDEIDLQIKEGKDPFCAILDSSETRFRPVMMASLTTILGMIPLLSDDMFGSAAATIMGGLLFGTIVTLIYIPIFYSIMFKVTIQPKKKKISVKK